MINNDKPNLLPSPSPVFDIPRSKLTNDEMMELDRKALQLAKTASVVFEAGDSVRATAVADEAIELMQQVADEMNRRREWIMRKYNEIQKKLD